MNIIISNIGQIAKSTFTGGFWGAVGSFLSFASGGGQFLERLFKHSFSQAWLEGIRGGNIKHGFLAGAVSVAGGEVVGQNWSKAGKIAANSVIAGTATELGGGKFANGAITGAFSMMFNDMMHKHFTDKQLKEIFDVYTDDAENYKSPASFYEYIGGPLGEWAKKNPEQFQNTCAARLSRALNYGGFEIPKGVAGTYKGGDGKYYFINAKQMESYLSKIWSSPTLQPNDQKIKSGVIFQTGFAHGVTGHLDVVYDGKSAHKMYSTTTYVWN